MEKITKSSDSILIDPNEPLILPDGTALVGRVEWFLYALCCLDYQNLPTPMSRIEEFANALITGEIPNIQPQSRAEQFFLAILDGNISDLPQPQSRSEVLLDKLARGEFDLSDVEPIQSSYELLLAYLIKNGGIGNIDYVLYEFSEAMKTMYNTVEKPFKSLELSGNTLVNCVLEDTENDDYVSFDQDYEGQSFTINGTSEGAIKSAILSGNTLVNLAKYELSTSSSEILCYQDDNLQKNNTVYTLVNLTDKQITFNTYANSSWRGFETVEANSKRLLTLNDFTINEVIGRTANGWDKTTETKKFLKGYMIIEGDYTNVDIPFFEGMQSVKNSQTLVNVVSSYEFGGDSMLYESRFYERPFNAGETFTIFVVNPNVTTIKVGLHNSVSGTWWGETEYNVSDNKKIVYTVPTGDILCKYAGVRVNTELDSTGFENSLVIVSGDKSNLEIENYFEGMQSVKMPVLKTVGKNLFDKTIKPIYVGGNGVVTYPNGNYGFEWQVVKPNTSYVLSYNVDNNSYKRNEISYYTKDKVYIKTEAKTTGLFTTPNNAHYIVTRLTVTNEPSNIQLEEGTVATSYEPFKSNILTTNEEVELRKVGNVQDELNLLTGELTQCIGEIVLDGSDDENWANATSGDGWYRHYMMNNLFGTDLAISDKYVYLRNLNDTNNSSVVGKIALHGSVNGYLYVGTNLSLNDFKHSLYQNPITVQYALAEESVKTVDLNVVDQNNTKIDKIHVFDEVTHVNASSDELTPTVNIGKSVSYPTIIKPNTKYTVDLKRNDKPLTVNLGGTEVTFASGETRKTITTPSTLTNDKLSYYGIGAKCNEIMLIEGEIERNVDYFTGMQSVVMQNQMPILSTVGKNLFNPLDLIISESQRVTCVAEPNRLSFRYKTGSHFNSSSYIQLEPNTKYWITITTKSYNKSEDEYVKLHLGKRPHHDSTEYGGFFIKASTDGTQYRSFTTDSDAKLYINGYVGSVGYDIWDIMLEKVEDSNASATPYEPYKTSILSCNDEIELNGIETYKDVLDCNNKKITRRTRKLLLNGSDDVQWNTYALNDEFPNVIGFYYTFPEEVKRYGNKYLYNGSLPPTERDVFPGNITSNEEVIVVRNNDHIKLSIYRNKLKSLNADGFKEWLSENPIELTYVLKNPIVSEVELSVIDQDGNTIPKIKSYKDVTHLEVSIPKQSLLPNVSAEVATDNSKDMSSLTIKHQEISEAQSTIEDSIQSQSDEIDTALMATTEIFESIL